jgi:nucleoside-diphosphate-sugar epimerase/putative sterol carrier protein
LIDQRKVKRIVSLDLHPPLVVSGKLDAIEADVRDPNLEAHLAGADALIHLAFIVTTKVSRELFDAVNVEGSKNVFRAAVKAGVKQIVYASSIAAYGVVPGHPIPIVETTPRVFHRDFPYAAAKYRVEEFLDALELQHPDVRVVRLRPAVLIGTRFQNPLAKVLGRALDRGLFPATSDAKLPIVWDEDVADAVLLAIQKEARGAFNLAARDPQSAEELARATGLRVVRPPRVALEAASRVSDALSRFGLGDPIDPTWRENGDIPMIIDAEKARRELGWAPKCDTAVDVVKRYLEQAPGRLDPRVDSFIRLLSVVAKYDRSERPSDLATMTSRVHLELTGRGGGDISILIERGVVSFGRGVPRPPTSVVSMPVSLFKEIMTGKTPYATAQITGRVKVLGDPNVWLVIDGMSRRFRSAQAVEGFRGRAARMFAKWIEGGAA